MKALLYSIGLFTICLAPFSGLYGAVISSGGDVKLSSSEIINENTYLAGGNVFIDTQVNGDLSIVGGDTIIQNDVFGDLIVLGGEVKVLGNVSGDIRIIGGNVNILGNVSGDLVILGGEIYISTDSVINGEAIFVGGRLKHEGSLENKSKIIVGNLNINGLVKGVTNVTTQNITFDQNSNVEGVFKYYSPTKAIEQPGSKLSGEIVFNEISSIRENGFVKQAILNFITFWILLKFITTLILAFILVYVFRVFSQKISEYALNSFGKALLIGILFILLTPILATLLLISLIALPIGFLLMLVYFFILMLSGAVSGLIVGKLIMEVLLKKPKREINFQTATLGVVVLSLIQFVPVLGDFTRFIFFFIAIGSVINYIYMNIRWRKIS